MKYERLTMSSKNIVQQFKNIKLENRNEFCLKCFARLAELEDKIEHGTLIELPIAYGTELHFLYSREHYGKQQPACVHSTRKWIFNIGYDGKMWLSVAGRGIGYYGDYTHELGKTVFLTREEAEKRLKELQE